MQAPARRASVVSAMSTPRRRPIRSVRRLRTPSDMNERLKAVEVTDSVFELWVGSAACAASVSFVAGSANVLRVAARDLTNGELEGGKGFAIGMPLACAVGVAAIGFVVTIVGLVHSLRRDGRHILSAPIGPLFS